MSADTSLPALVPATVNEAALSELGVKYLLPSYVDLHGVSKSKMVPVDHYDRMLTGSELCTGAALDGVPQDVSDEEVASHPDPSSCRVLPWNREVAWFASGAKARRSTPVAAISSSAPPPPQPLWATP